MNKTLKIVAFGNSAGVILPKDILASLKLDRGDE
jgi:antitoxin component of MazEF toxin-antitoxin module